MGLLCCSFTNNTSRFQSLKITSHSLNTKKRNISRNSRALSDEPETASMLLLVFIIDTCLSSTNCWQGSAKQLPNHLRDPQQSGNYHIFRQTTLKRTDFASTDDGSSHAFGALLSSVFSAEPSCGANTFAPNFDGSFGKVFVLDTSEFWQSMPRLRLRERRVSRDFFEWRRDGEGDDDKDRW